MKTKTVTIKSLKDKLFCPNCHQRQYLMDNLRFGNKVILNCGNQRCKKGKFIITASSQLLHDWSVDSLYNKYKILAR